MSRKRELLILALVLGAGFLLRSAYLLENSGTPFSVHPIGDEAFNDYWARSAASGHWSSTRYPNGPMIPQWSYYKAPGYPYLLTAVYRVTGSKRWPARALQLLLSTASCGLLYLLGRRLFNPAVGLLAAAGMSLYWVFIYYVPMLHAPTLVVFLILLWSYLLCRWQRRCTIGQVLALGLLLGLFGLVRKNAFVLIPLTAGWLWTRSEGQGGRNAALCLLCALLPLLPVGLRNLRVSGEWTTVSCDSGRNLYLGNNPLADGVHPVLPEQLLFTGQGSWSLFSYPDVVRGLGQYMGRPYSCRAAERFFARRALRFMLDNPGRFLRLTARKALLLAGPVEVSSDRVVPFDREASLLLRILPGNFALLFTLALLGLFMLWQDRHQLTHRPFLLFLAAAVSLYLLTFLPGLPESRYRVGILPFLLLLDGYAGHGLWRRMQQTRPASHLWPWLAAAAALYVLTATNLTGYQPDRAKWLYERGVVYERMHDRITAANLYGEAVAERPSFVEAHTKRGTLLAGLGEEAEAERHLRYALQLAPAYMQAHEALTLFLLQSGQNAEALKAAKFALTCRPEDHRAYHLVGLTLSQQGHYTGAIPFFERAVRMGPEDPIPHNNLGMALARVQRFDEARAQFETALQLRPDYHDARTNLAALDTAATFNPITPGR